jgi:hypothetical protein
MVFSSPTPSPQKPTINSQFVRTLILPIEPHNHFLVQRLLCPVQFKISAVLSRFGAPLIRNITYSIFFLRFDYHDLHLESITARKLFGLTLSGRKDDFLLAKKYEIRVCRLVFYWSPSFNIRSLRVTITTKTLRFSFC